MLRNIIYCTFLLLLLLACKDDRNQNFSKNANMISGDKNIFNEFSSSNFKLIIYYAPLSIMTPMPLDCELIKNNYYHYKITVEKSGLWKFIDEINKFNTIKLQETKGDKFVNIRVYCEINKNNEKVFSFCLSGCDGNMIVNDNIVKSHKYFYNFVKNFLPSSEIENYNALTKCFN